MTVDCVHKVSSRSWSTLSITGTFGKWLTILALALYDNDFIFCFIPLKFILVILHVSFEFGYNYY